MNKIVFLALIALSLAACKMSTEEDKDSAPAASAPIVPADNVRIRNSAWQIVKSDYLASRVGPSRNITSTDALKEEIEAYNAANTEDQWFLEEGEEVPIEEAPDAIAYIVNSATLEILFQMTVPRIELETKRELWRTTVAIMSDPITGKWIPSTLYVDNIPPEPPVIVPPEPRLWTALLDLTAEKIYYSQHFDTEAECLHQYGLNQVQESVYNCSDQEDGIDVSGHVWQAYIGETEATFEEPEE